MLLNLLPLRLGRIRLTHVLFGAVLAPVAPLLYIGQKVLGRYYALTQSAVEAYPMIGTARAGRVALADITAIRIDVRRGQRFYRAGDVILSTAVDDNALRLEGVPQPERVVSVIERLRESDAQRR